MSGRGTAREDKEEGRAFLWWPRTPVQGTGCGGGSVSWHHVAVVLAVLGRASLVEEVRLEGGRQRQCVDLTQTLLPQGQAHGTAAQIHEWQGLGWGNQGDRERQVSTALDSSTPNSTNNSSNSIINISFTMQTINE